MSFQIVRNDITRMHTDAIVNTANDKPTVGTGCDSAVYKAAGYDELIQYRKEKIGAVPEGEAFITPGFHLPARYIIHAVSPLYRGGDAGEEQKLRSCYRKSLALAKEYGIRSIAFPLISTGGFGYPREEGMRIAVDEIHAFLLKEDMEIFLVVFDDRSTELGEKLYPGLEAYIDHHYVDQKSSEEYDAFSMFDPSESYANAPRPKAAARPAAAKRAEAAIRPSMAGAGAAKPVADLYEEEPFLDFEEVHEGKLEERMRHLSDTFSQYLLYLISSRHMENADVYKRAIVDKKIFSKIKNNVNYHPQKLTALRLCVGARLNLDETRDLLARAGYALSPCDKTDIIFSYFIENGIYDMIELDIQLEEHGLPCIII